MNDQEGLKTAHKNVGTLELDPDILTYCTVGGKKSKESCFLKRPFRYLLSGTHLHIWKWVLDFVVRVFLV